MEKYIYIALGTSDSKSKEGSVGLIRVPLIGSDIILPLNIVSGSKESVKEQLYALIDSILDVT